LPVEGADGSHRCLRLDLVPGMFPRALGWSGAHPHASDVQQARAGPLSNRFAGRPNTSAPPIRLPRVFRSGAR